MSKQYDQKFKENAVAYYLEHKELGLEKAAENLGIGRTTLGAWTKAAKENDGSVPTRGSVHWKRLRIPARNNLPPYTFQLTAVICSFIIAGNNIAGRAGRKTLVHLPTGKFPVIY